MAETGTKNRILFLRQYLLDHTDDDHALSTENLNKTVIMYDEGAEEQTVILVCDNRLMQNVVDKFGEEIETDIIDDSRFSARVTVRPSRTFFSWAFGFCGGIRIVGPEDVREKYEGLLRKVLDGQEYL